MSLALPRFRRHEEHDRRVQRNAQILLGEDRTPVVIEAPSAGGRIAPGDAMTLRCIPVCAVGVPGVVPHTQPLQEAIRQENLREKAQSVRYHP